MFGDEVGVANPLRCTQERHATGKGGKQLEKRGEGRLLISGSSDGEKQVTILKKKVT